jgi:hypothetical protein
MYKNAPAKTPQNNKKTPSPIPFRNVTNPSSAAPNQANNALVTLRVTSASA